MSRTCAASKMMSGSAKEASSQSFKVIIAMPRKRESAEKVLAKE